MKKISKASSKRMQAALRYALEQVRKGIHYGLCSGIAREPVYEGMISIEEVQYLHSWIGKMLGGGMRGRRTFLEGPQPSPTAAERYKLRKPLVEWMCKHLEETT